jgi:putative ABC transport system permease protein
MSVICLLSLGEANQRASEAQIQSMGSNVIMITPGSKTKGLVKEAVGTATSLTEQDANTIVTQKFDHITNVAPEYVNRAQVVASRYNTNTQISGITNDYFTTKNIELSDGALFTDYQVHAYSRVAIVGPTVAKAIFPNKNPINQTFRINGEQFQVVGIAASKGIIGSKDLDDVVYIPLATAQKILFGVDYISTIYIKVDDEANIPTVQNNVFGILLQKHNIKNVDKVDFAVQSQQDIIETAKTINQSFNNILLSSAIIGLVVGGMGIMNSMLMIVTERTPEIGLRKALGATQQAISIQFLVESVVLTISGGLLGIMLGLVSLTIYYTYTNQTIVISIISLMISFGVSVTIGIIFGWYPAKKAAALQPIDALRYE